MHRICRLLLTTSERTIFCAEAVAERQSSRHWRAFPRRVLGTLTQDMQMAHPERDLPLIANQRGKRRLSGFLTDGVHSISRGLSSTGFRVPSRHRAILIAATVCAGIELFPIPAEADYAANEVGLLPAGSGRIVRKMNEAGDIVGGSPFSANGRQPRAWFIPNGGKRQMIPELPGSDHSTAFGINGASEVVGAANVGARMRAFRSEKTGAIVELGTLPGDSSSAAIDNNDAGQVVGFSSGPSGVRAVLWSRGVIQALPLPPGVNDGKALAINNRGDAVGTVGTVSGPVAVYWPAGGGVKGLDTLPGHSISEALGINNGGDSVGSSGDPGETQRHAVLWDKDGTVRDLGTLPGGTLSLAVAINDRREVVGTSDTSVDETYQHASHAFLWTSSAGMQDLNSLLTTPSSDFVLTRALSITKQGAILAVGFSKAAAGEPSVESAPELKQERIYRLIPGR